MNAFKKLINFYFHFHFENSIFDKLIAFFMQFAIIRKKTLQFWMHGLEDTATLCNTVLSKNCQKPEL